MTTGKDPKIGRFLFESITKGLYDNPLCIFREYVQNAADAIDEAMKAGALHRKTDAYISIKIDPSKEEEIVIEDNGCGIPSGEAAEILSSIGDSAKFGGKSRGFRGIGRLGGMAYCSHLTFRSKARNDKMEMINTWDCKKMQLMLNPNNRNYKGMPLQEVIRECSTFELKPCTRPASNAHFIVGMKGVRSAKDVLKDLVRVRAYLAEVAPVPFDQQQFPIGKEIDEYLRSEIPSYETYRLMVNDEPVFKPHRMTVELTQNKSDHISGFDRIEVLDLRDKPIAKGWVARRKDLVGVVQSDGCDGIRVRVGNILIGGSRLLSGGFSQPRFNAYFVGELHPIDSELVPNAQREAFEDSEISNIFYEQFEKQIGQPLSKKVSQASQSFNRKKVVAKAEYLVKTVKSTIGKGFLGTAHKEKTVKELRAAETEIEGLLARRKCEEEVKSQAATVREQIGSLREQISEQGTGGKLGGTLAETLCDSYSRAEKILVGKVFDHLYSQYEKTKDATSLAQAITRRLNSEAR